MSATRFVIAGGGTGGHVVPGLAVARALVAAGAPVESIHWVGSERGMEVEAVPAAGFALSVLPGRGIERKLTLELTPQAKAFLAETGYDPAYGARPLKRLIEKRLADPLARELLAGSYAEGETILIDAASNGEGLVFSRAEAVGAKK